MRTANKHKPPKGGRTWPPTSANPSVGLRGLRPCVFPTLKRGAPPGDAFGIVVAPLALVQYRIPAYQGAQVAVMWGGTSRPASLACSGATASGCATTKHRARVAHRRNCAAFGYIGHRAISDRVLRLRFFHWSAIGEGCHRWPFRPWWGGRSPHGGLGVQPPAVEQP